MRKIERLRKEAIEACEFRGHTMYPFAYVHAYGRHTAYSACIHCGKEVQIIPKPYPNEIEIGGEAVALGCT